MPLGIIFSLIAFEVLLIFVHLAVYATLAAAFGIGSSVLAWVFVALALTFLTSSVLTHYFQNRLVDWYYIAAAYWFGLINFLFVGAVIFFFASKLLYANNYYVPPALIGGIAFGALFIVHLYGTWSSGRAQTTSIKVSLPNLPASWRGKKAVFVSDVHLGNIRTAKFAKRVVRNINTLKPEAVFIGGDLYDGVRCDIPGIIEPLRELHAPLGIYYITGNHEYYLKDVPRALRAIGDLGIRILGNAKADVGGLTVIGVDDKDTHNREQYKKILENIGVEKNKPTILLKHEPDHLDVARDAGIAMGFFGHTHRGQIYPLSYITKQMYKGFDYGLKRLGSLQVYTSSGVGTWGPPLRLGTRSEIVLVEFS